MKKSRSGEPSEAHSSFFSNYRNKIMCKGCNKDARRKSGMSIKTQDVSRIDEI